MKCLEFLHTLFHVLTTAGYRMSEYEAGAFLPYLVIKVSHSVQYLIIRYCNIRLVILKIQLGKLYEIFLEIFVIFIHLVNCLYILWMD